jgi:hypothetical protein
MFVRVGSGEGSEFDIETLEEEQPVMVAHVTSTQINLKREFRIFT